MINIKKIKKEIKEVPEITINIGKIHGELKKISNKFIGITIRNNEVVDIIVEDNISENKINQLKTKLNELGG